jgi:hypothetical protein
MDKTSVFAARVLAIMLLAVAITGCVRFSPEASGPVRLARACPLQIAPEVTDYGPDGVYAMYHYVIQDASIDDIIAFQTGRIAAGFAVVQVIMNINGKDTLFVRGARAMRSQPEIDIEFSAACQAGFSDVYLTHVLYQPFDSENTDQTSMRLR